jgi:hypothetical protein
LTEMCTVMLKMFYKIKSGCEYQNRFYIRHSQRVIFSCLKQTELRDDSN